jgi:hypothetical protein
MSIDRPTMKKIASLFTRISAPLAVAAFIFLPVTTSLQAQCFEVTSRCEGMLDEFLSDGEDYRAQVVGAKEVTLHVTLYEGFRYRIVTCNDRPGALVKYRVLDGSNTEVFHNYAAKDGDYWDLELESTDKFTIKASIPNNQGTGCIVFEVGYDEEMMTDDDDWSEEDDPFFEDELDYDLDEDEAKPKSK